MTRNELEHAPLLENDGVKTYGTKGQPQTVVAPHELPRSTRYGILLGVWIANFLSVSILQGYSNSN